MVLISIFCSWEFIVFLTFYVIWRFSRSRLWIDNIQRRHVFITGCDSGFGRLLAESLDLKGVNVYAGCLLSSSVEELKRKGSSRMKPVLIDVTDSTSVRKAANYVKDQLDGKALWAVVNNAGIAGINLPFEWTTKEDCQKTLDVNLLGVYDVTLTFLPLIKRGREGRVINIASVFGRVGLLLSGYTMSKYGIECFSDGLSLELSPYNITVHTLEPGYFKTNIPNKDINEAQARDRWAKLDQSIKEMHGEDFIEKIVEFSSKYLEQSVSPKLHLVVEAYEHAILAKYPKNRYVVGNDAKFLYIPLSWLPFPYQVTMVNFGLRLFGGIAKPIPNDAVTDT